LKKKQHTNNWKKNIAAAFRITEQQKDRWMKLLGIWAKSARKKDSSILGVLWAAGSNA
jgi:hypothetical protein